LSAGRHLAVWIASIVFFVLGAIWYSVMATPWVAAIGKTMDQLSREHGTSPLPYVVGFVAILVMCYLVAALVARLSATSFGSGARIGALAGLLPAACIALNYAFEMRPPSLWLINAGYVVVGLAIAGATIGGWTRKTVVA